MMGYYISVQNKKAKKTTDSNGKKKIILFACDIMGTIDKTNYDDYESLAEKVQQLKEKNDAEEVVFSLITGDSEESYLIHYFEKNKSSLEQNYVVIGKQFMEHKYYYGTELTPYYKNSKIEKIIDYVNELKTENEVVAVYYTDDRPTYINDSIREALGDTIYYCLSIANFENSVGDNLASSMDNNIWGVLQAIDFHLEPQQIEETLTKKLTPPFESSDEANDEDLPF